MGTRGKLMGIDRIAVYQGLVTLALTLTLVGLGLRCVPCGRCGAGARAYSQASSARDRGRGRGKGRASDLVVDVVQGPWHFTIRHRRGPLLCRRLLRVRVTLMSRPAPSSIRL